MKKADLTLRRLKAHFKGGRIIKCQNCGYEWITRATRKEACCTRCHRYTPIEEGDLIE